MLRSLPSRIILSAFTLDLAVLVALALVAGQGSSRYLTAQLRHLEAAISGHPVMTVERQRDLVRPGVIGAAGRQVFRPW